MHNQDENKKDRSCYQGVFCKKGVSKNFAKFKRKHLSQSLPTLFKARLWHRCFSVNFTKIFKNTFFIEQLRWPGGCFWKDSISNYKIITLHINLSQALGIFVMASTCISYEYILPSKIVYRET